MYAHLAGPSVRKTANEYTLTLETMAVTPVLMIRELFPALTDAGHKFGFLIGTFGPDRL